MNRKSRARIHPLNSPATVVRTAALLARRTSLRPRLALILGSGFQPVVDRVQVAVAMGYDRLPGFLPVRVTGHEGRLLIGHLGGTPVIVLSGRPHYYEGYTMAQVTFPIRVLAKFGVQDLILTNAAGGINPRYQPGDFMRLTDHINFMGANPLRGTPVPGRERFIDLTDTYAPALGDLLSRAAKSVRVKLQRGVYLAVAGPSYETPAEIRAFARLGADAVGMSTVPEAIVARQHGLGVAGLSCITNAAAGLHHGKLAHHDILEQSRRVATPAARLLERFARLYDQTKRGPKCSGAAGRSGPFGPERGDGPLF